MSRTCQSLGVCQHRTPPCRGCEPVQAQPIRFAPGVISSPASRRQRTSLARGMGRALGVMVLVATVAMWASILSGRAV
ncbi:MAG: hypothetical protein Q7K57_12805 [Burkholderiaceae bacterium]|nr:hypothetical protein [Burkholderiaceae bacterium]